jgi:SAM-dependent methyltransferase
MFPIDLKKYPLPEMDQARVADLIRLIPKNGGAALDVGALWGYFSEYLSTEYNRVTALDLEKPTWELPRVNTVAGDLTRLQFPDNSFDLVFCAEVLEHIPQVEKAASELARVTRRHLVVGVPFHQDLRVGRLTCVHCGKVNPPYGHVNSFTESKLKSLFPSLKVVDTSLIYPLPVQRTNELSRWLLDAARNPYGDYDRLEPCMYCNRKLERPPNRTLFERGCSFLAYYLNAVQNASSSMQPGWIHVVFEKK